MQGRDLPEEQKSIFEIQFSFNNSELIEKLEARGKALRSANFEKVSRIEHEMTALKNEEGNLEKFCEPLTMIVTFDYGTGIYAALEKKYF